MRRLENTLDITQGIIHGDRQEAERALRAFHARHAHVQGILPHAVGPFAAGCSYRGDDPELKLWVHATIIDTLLVTYERFVRPLKRSEQSHFYEDARLLAVHYGIPSKLVPPTLEQFQGYMRRMLEGDILTVSDSAISLAAVTVIDPQVRNLARCLARWVRFITAGMLPESLRRAYGFVWNPQRQAVLDVLSRASRQLVPVLPIWIRYTPRSGRSGLVRWVIRGSQSYQTFDVQKEKPNE
jgi:uncharacterized protein (DUF2236 family)